MRYSASMICKIKAKCFFFRNWVTLEQGEIISSLADDTLFLLDLLFGKISSIQLLI